MNNAFLTGKTVRFVPCSRLPGGSGTVWQLRVSVTCWRSRFTPCLVSCPDFVEGGEALSCPSREKLHAVLLLFAVSSWFLFLTARLKPLQCVRGQH